MAIKEVKNVIIRSHPGNGANRNIPNIKLTAIAKAGFPCAVNKRNNPGTCSFIAMPNKERPALLTYIKAAANGPIIAPTYKHINNHDLCCCCTTTANGLLLSV